MLNAFSVFLKLLLRIKQQYIFIVGVALIVPITK